MAVNLFASPSVPTEVSDPINARILAISEDRIAGFVDEPFAAIATTAEVTEDVVIERLRAMLSASVMRLPQERNTMPETSVYYHLAYTIALGIYAAYGLSLYLRRKRVRAK